MIGRALDSNNDLIVENGQLTLVRDGAEAVQHVRTRLLFYKGEWFLDTNAGVPWLQDVFVKPVNLAKIESIIKTAILKTPTVLKLNSFSMVYEGPTTRRLLVSYNADTVYGTINTDEVTINV